MEGTVAGMGRPELLAPAGNWDCARAAAANGADAIYFGTPHFNARMRADNFSMGEIPGLMRFLHGRGMRGYATLNVLVFTEELGEVARLIDRLAEAGVDALIVQDLAIARVAAEAGVEVHASTQMTVTSPEGVEFARRLGVQRVVLARETSLREMERFARPAEGGLPLEVFVHGALCVAYSGQCLTSEALGQRSANRGECAQACRMPYRLVVDGALRHLGDRRYLLSPQDLAAVDEIPQLIARGVASFKIEGRLKSPEYVAAVCSVYRKAIDAALAGRPTRPLADGGGDRYRLEMAFSRGLFTGWMGGVDHQRLVHARFGKKRGVLLGRVVSVGVGHVVLDRLEAEAKAGDGVVFDQGGDTEDEVGGRLFAVEGARLDFGRGLVDLGRVRAGDRVWKTDDPALRKELRRSFEGVKADTRSRIDLAVTGRFGEPLTVTAVSEDGRRTSVCSSAPLDRARNRPLTPEMLAEQFGRLGETPFRLGRLVADLGEEPLILPLSQLSELRRRVVAELVATEVPDKGRGSGRDDAVAIIESRRRKLIAARAASKSSAPGRGAASPQLAVLCRSEEQVRAALEAGVREVHLDFEDIRRFKPAVKDVRLVAPEARVFLATPRIQKASESGFFKMIAAAEPDGVLARNLGALAFFQGAGIEMVADFSMNAANPLTAEILRSEGATRVVPSFDLDAKQLGALLRAAPPEWFQVVIHQHIPMFHMEHCVFAAFLSEGKDHLTCGRPCDRHKVRLRDRVGQEHPVTADVGCRNTVFNGRAQSAAPFFSAIAAAGARDFRIDLLDESASETSSLIGLYRSLIKGRIDPERLIAGARAVGQLGVIGGTLTVLDRS